MSFSGLFGKFRIIENNMMGTYGPEDLMVLYIIVSTPI
jgi:hypothetical protein